VLNLSKLVKILISLKQFYRQFNVKFTPKNVKSYDFMSYHSILTTLDVFL